MKKVICECGSNEWRLKESLVYTCIPPIHADIYACVKCGKTYEKTTQQTMEEYNPVVELYDDEPEVLKVGTSVDYSNYGDFYELSDVTVASGTLTGGNDTVELIKPSKVTFEEKQDGRN